jgi:hypothetical protein
MWGSWASCAGCVLRVRPAYVGVARRMSSRSIATCLIAAGGSGSWSGFVTISGRSRVGAAAGVARACQPFREVKRELAQRLVRCPGVGGTRGFGSYLSPGLAESLQCASHSSGPQVRVVAAGSSQPLAQGPYVRARYSAGGGKVTGGRCDGCEDYGRG